MALEVCNRPRPMQTERIRAAHRHHIRIKRHVQIFFAFFYFVSFLAVLIWLVVVLSVCVFLKIIFMGEFPLRSHQTHDQLSMTVNWVESTIIFRSRMHYSVTIKQMNLYCTFIRRNRRILESLYLVCTRSLHWARLFHFFFVSCRSYTQSTRK